MGIQHSKGCSSPLCDSIPISTAPPYYLAIYAMLDDDKYDIMRILRRYAAAARAIACRIDIDVSIIFDYDLMHCDANERR